MRPMWPTLPALLHYSLALVVVLRVLLTRRMSPPARLAWILLVEVVPVVGIATYLLFGEVRMRRAERHMIAAYQAAAPNALREQS